MFYYQRNELPTCTNCPFGHETTQKFSEEEARSSKETKVGFSRRKILNWPTDEHERKERGVEWAGGI
jgi:hypothetical protein